MILGDLSARLGVPAPRVVFTRTGAPYYENGVIYIPVDLPEDMVPRVVVHEFAHHLHTFYGVEPPRSVAEAFASVFEEALYRRYKYPLGGSAALVLGAALVVVSLALRIKRLRK
jgi:hypothetical protein